MRVKRKALSGLRAAVVLCAGLMLAGCVSTAERTLRAREGQVRATLATLKPGATRADLVRLLPPTAQARPHEAALIFPQMRKEWGGVVHTRVSAWYPMVGTRRAKSWGLERHPLNAELELSVAYEYQHYRRIRSKPGPYPKEKVTTNAIDALLFGIPPATTAPSDAPGQASWLQMYRVWPSPRDRIITNIPPALRRRALPGTEFQDLIYSPDPRGQPSVIANSPVQ